MPKGLYLRFEFRAALILSPMHLTSLSNNISTPFFGGNQYVMKTNSMELLVELLEFTNTPDWRKRIKNITIKFVVTYQLK